MPVSTKVYSDLLEALYAATLDESQWQGFLSRLCDATQSTLGILLRNDGTLGRRVLATGGLPGSATAVPNQESYTRVDPIRAAFMRSPRTGIIEVEDILPHEQLERHEYYPTMVATGAVYGTCIVPCISLRRYDLIALWRGDGRPRLEPDQLELLTMLFPHIQCALRIHQALGVAEERAHNAEAILDASSTPSLVVEESGKLLYMNAAARKLVQGQDGFSERDGCLTTAQSRDRQELHALLADVAAGADRTGGAMTLHRTGSRRPLHLLVSRFPSPAAERASGRTLILATDPCDTAQFPDAILRKLYGFTAAETEIANGLLTGFSVQEIAAVREVSVATVRSQLKSMLSKTGTRRQVDFVRLLATLPKPVSSPAAAAAATAEANAGRKLQTYRI